MQKRKMDSPAHKLIGRRISKVTAAILLSIAIAATAGAAPAGEGASGSLPTALKGIKFGALAYIDFSAGKSPLADHREANYNSFTLTRGYFTVRKKMKPWLGTRITIDIHQDNTGDYKVRQKYLYAELKPGDIGPLTNIKAEIGLGHIPWIDFEEHINPYRCQGTMAIERAGVFNSADVGVSLQGLFGKHLENAQERTGNRHFAGRYGSWHIGVYNGGGYHASETNENKVGEFRLTARPLPDILPGLQLSYLGIFGKGNTTSAPDYTVNIGMLSFEHPTITLTAQFFEAQGNAKGSWVDTNGVIMISRGYSVFGNMKILNTGQQLSIFGRYDFVDSDIDNHFADETAYSMIIGGLAYEIYKENLILLTVEYNDYENDSAGKGKVPVPGKKLGKDQKVQVVYQIKF